jgi:hypothetical protein
MCVFCDHRNLRLLLDPLEELEPGELAEAVRAAREAAHVGILGYAEAVLGGEATGELNPDLYLEVVLSRAEEAGVVDRAGAYAVAQRLATSAGLRDPRVQAFLSCSAEVLDEYKVACTERRQLIARYIEAAPGTLHFTHIGHDGELWFEYGADQFAALRREEAMSVVEREVASGLHDTPAGELLRYTELPASALDVIVATQKRGEREANEILDTLVDVRALAEERVREYGFAHFFRRPGEDSRVLEAVPFGEWLVLRSLR